MRRGAEGDLLRIRGGVNWGWYYWTWPFGILEFSPATICVRYPGGRRTAARAEVQRIYLSRWPIRGIRFERVDGSKSPAFLAGAPYEVLAMLRLRGWPVSYRVSYR